MELDINHVGLSMITLRDNLSARLILLITTGMRSIIL